MEGITRLIRPATHITTNNPSAGHPLYPYPVGVHIGYIGEGLPVGRYAFVESGSVAHYFGDLPSACIAARPEVWPVEGITRLIEAATYITTNDTSAGHPLYPWPERMRVGHIRKGLLAGRYWLIEARSVTDDLGKLSPCHVIARSESIIGIAGDYAATDQAPDVGIEGIGRWYVSERYWAWC